MDYKATGTIVEIDDIQTFDSGAKKTAFRIDTGEQYGNILAFELFKKEEYAEHVEKFLQYNKIGDNVEVEFNIRTNEHNGRYYTSLTVWKCAKVDIQEPTGLGGSEIGLPY